MTLELIAAGIIAILAAIAGAFRIGRKSATDSAKVDALKKEVKAHEIRNEVENRVATERNARERLRDDWSE